MVENQDQAENAKEVEKRKIFRRGKKIGEDMYEVHIQPNEPILHGWMRAKIEWWHYNKINSLLATFGIGLLVAYGFYHYFGYYFGIVVAIIVFVVTPIEFWEEKNSRKRNIVKARMYRPEGIIAPVDIQIGEDKHVNIWAYRPDSSEKGRDVYEEWFYSKRLEDPKNPKAVHRIDAPLIDTGYSTYVFGIEVRPKERVIIGDKGMSIPVMALIDIIEETETFINKSMEEINKLRKANKIKLEVYVEANEKAHIAKERFYEFINYVKANHMEGKFLKDLPKAEQQLVVALDRDSSEVYGYISQLRSWTQYPRAVRQGKAVSAINEMNADTRRTLFWIAHEHDVRRESFVDAYTAAYINSGRDPKNDIAFNDQLNKELEKIPTKEERQIAQEVISDGDQ